MKTTQPIDGKWGQLSFFYCPFTFHLIVSIGKGKVRLSWKYKYGVVWCCEEDNTFSFTTINMSHTKQVKRPIFVLTLANLLPYLASFTLNYLKFILYVLLDSYFSVQWFTDKIRFFHTRGPYYFRCFCQRSLPSTVRLHCLLNYIQFIYHHL